MYKDYLDEILNYYREEERSAKLPQRLISPTAGDLKNECVAVFNARFQKKDLGTLVSFFRADNDPDNISRFIRNFDREKFKPLANFLIGKTNKTDDLNIELLAWLINFPNRPYTPDSYRKNDVEENGDNNYAKEQQHHHEWYGESTEGENLKSNEGNDGEKVPDEVQRVEFRKKKFGFERKSRKNILVVAIALPILVGFYFVIDSNQRSPGLAGNQQCMMWVGDHYVQTTCDPREGDTIVVALDIRRLNNFKLITRPDTITVLSERKLWYIRRNGQIEYYTAGGKHPIDPNKQLRSLTRYMIEKHLAPP